MITFANLGKYGRLGNQMFQIASTIGVAVKSGFDYGFPVWQNIDHANKGFKEDIEIWNYFKNQLPLVIPGKYTELQVAWGWYEFCLKNDNISLNGHMQSDKYFRGFRPLIQHYFELKDQCPEFNPGENSIAIHVRRGDYDGNYHTKLDENYYHAALKLFEQIGEIYIFSDDINECRKMFGSDVNYISGNHYMKDFAMMSKCNHFIIGNSTFSWWPAWLSDAPGKNVIAPRQWFGKACGLETKDIYADNWIAL